MRREDDTEFNIRFGFKTPIALAPMAGIVDSKFAKKFDRYAGLVILGGFSADTTTMEASRRMVDRGRREFIVDDPLKGIDRELKRAGKLKTRVAINVRASEPSVYEEVAAIAKKRNSIVEINAHCRQKEIVNVGAGEYLLAHPEKLCEIVERVKAEGVITSVKIRSGVVEEASLARVLQSAGLDILHVDAMGSEKYDLRVIKSIRNNSSMFIIGNNSIRSFDDAKNMFTAGADMISIARGVVDNPNVFKEILEKIIHYTAEFGWYNAPKHICRGGDVRGLTFCCKPLKPCAIQKVLKEYDISPFEFMRLKEEFARGTVLELGKHTCFGSLVYCCKATRPCYIRDSTLKSAGFTLKDYMNLKRELAEYLMNHLL